MDTFVSLGRHEMRGRGDGAEDVLDLVGGLVDGHGGVREEVLLSFDSA
jgi:hypothetical protein